MLGSVHEINVGGNVDVLDGDKSYTQNKETNKKTRTNDEQSQCVMRVWVPVKEGEVAKEMERVLKGNRIAILATEAEVHPGFARRV